MRFAVRTSSVFCVFLVVFVQDLSPSVFRPEQEALSSSNRAERPRDQRIEKIGQILSRFDTGLSGDEEARISFFIEAESRRYGYDPELILAMISTESSFQNWAVSEVGAQGLMQIVPETGREIAENSRISWRGEDPLFDPFLNIRLGIQYLNALHQKFGNLRLALVAYNQGPGRVLHSLSHSEPIPMDYAEKVLTEYRNFLSVRIDPSVTPISGGETS